MEQYDQTVIQHLCDGNARFRMLYEEHMLLEKELADLNQKPFLSPEDEVIKKKVQKLKLAGKDEMERILRNVRQ